MSFLAKHGSDLLGLGIVGAVGYGLYTEYEKSRPQKPSSSSSSSSATAAVSKYNAKDYLSELAKSGDETAAKALTAPKPVKPDFFQIDSPAAAEDLASKPFRFDLTPDALEHALRNILEGKRKHEQKVLDEFKRTGYPKGYEDTLRDMRADREEVAALLTRLERRPGGKKSTSWWWW